MSVAVDMMIRKFGHPVEFESIGKGSRDSLVALPQITRMPKENAL